jgi:hypothetical protein
MIEVRIPKEIREYKEKLFFGFDMRQCVSTGIAMIVCVPLYVYGQKYVDADILSWLILLIAAPLILIGFFNFNQMPFEKFVIVWLKMQFNPQKRPFKYVPIYKVLRDDIILEEIKEYQDSIKPDNKNSKPSPKKPQGKKGLNNV